LLIFCRLSLSNNIATGVSFVRKENPQHNKKLKTEVWTLCMSFVLYKRFAQSTLENKYSIDTDARVFVIGGICY
jgi:hypothetical protein